MSVYIARSSAIAARSLEGEMIIMSTKDSKLFTLNEVASEIWRAADGRTPLSDIVQNGVCRNFQTEPAVAYADAEAFCRELAASGILLLSDQPIASAGPTA